MHAAVRALLQERGIKIPDPVWRQPKLPAMHAALKPPVKAVALLKMRCGYKKISFMLYRDLEVSCTCGQLIKTIPGAWCISCGNVVESISETKVFQLNKPAGAGS